MLADEAEIIAITELLGVRRLVADELEAGNAAAFLIDRNDGLDVAKIAQIVDEFAQLGGGLDVPSEEDESSGLEFLVESGVLRREFISGDADEQKLTRVVRWHNPSGSTKSAPLSK